MSLICIWYEVSRWYNLDGFDWTIVFLPVSYRFVGRYQIIYKYTMPKIAVHVMKNKSVYMKTQDLWTRSSECFVWTRNSTSYTNESKFQNVVSLVAYIPHQDWTRWCRVSLLGAVQEFPSTNNSRVMSRRVLLQKSGLSPTSIPSRA